MCFVAGEEWKKLSQADRAPYDKGAQEEQRKYEVKLAEWRKVGPWIKFQFISWNAFISIIFYLLSRRFSLSEKHALSSNTVLIQKLHRH